MKGPIKKVKEQIKLNKTFMANIRHAHEVIRAEKTKTKRELSKLENSYKVNTSELLSDLRYFRPGFFRRLKIKASGKSFIRCIIHMPDGMDVVRFFPIYRNNVVDINNEYYIFSPSSYRYINGIPTLYFYHGVPFSLLHDPVAKIPTYDAKAFTSVQRSKFISDALEGETPKIGPILIWIILIMCIFNLIATIIMGIITAQTLKGG